MSSQNSTTEYTLRGPEVTVMDMMEARERRYYRQLELRQNTPGRTMISFTMNIAGPVKNNDLIRRGFIYGCDLIRQQLMRIRSKSERELFFDEKTGFEAYFMIDLPADKVKRMTVELEDHDVIGRLFDMDVLDGSGRKLDRSELGLPSRTCLLCGNLAKICGRSRTHTAAQLQAKTAQMLTEFVREHDLTSIARNACRALLYEVCTTPKPGLVDRANAGSHRDMDIYTFLDSATALLPYLRRCGEIGMDMRGLAPTETFRQIRQAGVAAERDMLQATNGVNTHKGAIFSMGIACAALGRLDHALWKDPASVLAECGRIAEGVASRDFAKLEAKTSAISASDTAAPSVAAPSVTAASPAGPTPSAQEAAPGAAQAADIAAPGSAQAFDIAAPGAAQEAPEITAPIPLTVGEKLYLAYGIRGVRGQAEDGFPAVLHAGLPVLERELAAGADINRAGSVALLAILCADTDTNLIARGGRKKQLEVTEQVRQLLSQDPSPSEAVIDDLDRQFISDNLSPGGSADLLGLCYLLHFLKTEAPNV